MEAKTKPVVDTREPDTISHRLALVGWSRDKLDYGDYLMTDVINQIILWERKELDQLFTDLQSGQLQRQCIGMRQNADGVILLGEGHFDIYDGWLLDSRGKKRIPWHDFWKGLYSLKVDFQLTTDIDDTIRRLIEFQWYFQKEVHESVQRVLNQDPQVAVLSAIPGVGTAKAKALLLKLPDLRQIANATTEELQQAEGIGVKLARKIHQFWGDDKPRGLCPRALAGTPPDSLRETQ